MLRLLSFNMDYHWACTRQKSQSTREDVRSSLVHVPIIAMLNTVHSSHHRPGYPLASSPPTRPWHPTQRDQKHCHEGNHGMFRALSRLLCRRDKQKRPIASWTRRPPPPHPPSQPPRLRPLHPRLSSSSTPQLLIFIAHHLIALRPAPLSRHNSIPATIATFAPMPLLYPSQNIRCYTSTARWPQRLEPAFVSNVNTLAPPACLPRP